MFAILSILMIAAAGVGACLAIAATVREQAGALRRLLADSRSIARDREFLVRMTGDGAADRPIAFARLRRMPHRAVSRPVVRIVPQRAAA